MTHARLPQIDPQNRQELARTILLALKQDQGPAGEDAPSFPKLEKEVAARILPDLLRALDGRKASQARAARRVPRQDVPQYPDPNAAISKPASALPQSELINEHPMVLALLLRSDTPDRVAGVLQALPSRVAERVVLALCDIDEKRMSVPENARKLILSTLAEAS